MVGRVIFWIQYSRFDTAFSVMQAARHISNLTIHHLAAVKRTFRYLKGTPDLPIIYGSSKNNLRLQGFCYSSFGNADTQGRMRLTTETVFCLANGWVHFPSNLQNITASSTTEAELISSARCGKFGTYLSNLIRKLGWSSLETPTMFSDLKGALHLSSNSN